MEAKQYATKQPMDQEKIKNYLETSENANTTAENLSGPFCYCWFTSGQSQGLKDSGTVAHLWHVQLDPGVGAD